MKTKFFLLFFLIFFMSSLVLADNISVISNNNDVFNVDNDFNLTVQVFNLSNGAVLSGSVSSCSIYLYNKYGGVVDSDSMGNIGAYDKFYTVNSDFFGDVGKYSYNVYCSIAGIHGSVSDGFLLSKSGLGVNDMFKIVLIYIIGLMAIIIILLYIVFNIDNKHIVLKFFIVSLSIYLPITITRAIYLLEPNGLALDLIKYYLRIIYFFTVYIFLAFLWMVAEYYNKTLGIKRWFKEKVGRKGYE